MATRTLVAVMGVSYIIAMVVLLTEFKIPPGGLWIGFATMPVLFSARLPVKRALYPGAGWLEEPPRDK